MVRRRVINAAAVFVKKGSGRSMVSGLRWGVADPSPRRRPALLRPVAAPRSWFPFRWMQKTEKDKTKHFQVQTSCVRKDIYAFEFEIDWIQKRTTLRRVGWTMKEWKNWERMKNIEEKKWWKWKDWQWVWRSMASAQIWGVAGPSPRRRPALLRPVAAPRWWFPFCWNAEYQKR